MTNNILVIGAGIAGMQASLMLAEAGKKVYLVERNSLIGGNAVKFEDVYPNMECATCMLAPKQQQLLQNANIELLTLASVEDVSGDIGNFNVTVRVKAGYVSAVECIGCGACYEPCPVSIPNSFEQNLSERKAIFVPCPGALPNVPIIDTENCLRFTKNEECTLCQEACMFEAIDFDQQDKELKLNVDAIIVATGFGMYDVSGLSNYGYSDIPAVYTAMEFERLFASNGPTLGELTLRDGEKPGKVAIIHCVGREDVGYCSGVCCMYSIKFTRFVKHKLHDANVVNLYSDLCVPGKLYQSFYQGTLEEGVSFIRCENVSVCKNGKGAVVKYDMNGSSKSDNFDMVILSSATVPADGAKELAQKLEIEIDDRGFFATGTDSLAPVTTSRKGVYIAGCAEGPKDIASSVTQAAAAVSKALYEVKTDE